MSTTPTAPGQVTPNSDPQTPEGQAPAEERTFSQADLDRVVAERLAREQRKYGNYEDLKAKAARLDEMEAANATDIEKAAKTARDEAIKELTGKHLRERLLDKVEVAAAGKFADLEDARLRLAARLDEFVKDGQIDTDAINAAIEKVLEDHPHLRANSQGTPPPSRAGIGVSGGQSPASPAQLFARMAEQALSN